MDFILFFETLVYVCRVQIQLFCFICLCFTFLLYFQVGPQAIYVVGRDDDDESIVAGSELSDAASWETVNDDEMEALEDSREVCFFFCPRKKL